MFKDSNVYEIWNLYNIWNFMYFIFYMLNKGEFSVSNWLCIKTVNYEKNPCLKASTAKIKRGDYGT